MPPRVDDLADEEPPSINPYEVLELEKTATADEIKFAYRKSALRNHPDKAPEHLKATAHTTFQEIAFAYAVLSDPIRRKRYDTTGSTSESIVDSDGFSWSDFYSEQYRDVVSEEAIEKFAKQYIGSDEEKDDLLGAFQKYKGKMDKIYEVVMLSNPIEDEERFRVIIDAAIANGELKGYTAYVKESAASKAKRMQDTKDEAQEAMEYAEELGVADKLFAKGGKTKSNEDSLMALIQKRQQDRSSFLDDLEAKYGGKASKSKGKKGKKRSTEDDDGGELSEEAFQKAAARLNGGKGSAGKESGDGKKAKRAKH